MADTTLPNTGLTQVEVGGSENTWGTKLNANAAILDALFHATTGHDHSGAGNGAQIPSGGLKSLSDTSQGLVASHGDGTFEMASVGNGLILSEANALAASINPLAAKTTPADADELMLADSASSYTIKKVTRANLLTGAVLAGTPYAHTSAGGAGSVSLNAALYGSFALTVTGTITLSITGAETGKLYVIRVEVTNGGAHTFNHPSGTTHPGGIAPTLSAAGTDVLFYASRDGGTTWRCSAEIAHA